MSKPIKKKMQIHYYLNDDSHTMNAFARNEAEKDMLKAIKQILTLYGDTVVIETEAYKEGGLKELLTFTVTVSSAIFIYLSPSINNIITHHFTKNDETIKIEQEILKQTLKNLKKKEIGIDIEKSLEDKQTARCVSNYYTKIDNYHKVQKVGFKDITENNGNKEYIVNKEYFKNFILKDTNDTIEDEGAIIEIISPILKKIHLSGKGYTQTRI